MDKLSNLLFKIRSKIAFFPTIISLAGLVMAFAMIYVEKLGISDYLMNVAPSLVIDDTDTAKTILSTLIAGLISLTVFSFSMVMLLLSQASSNFSPRVLPGIISNQTNQIVLGQYIATILYNIFILISLEPKENEYQTPGFSVLLGIILAVLCLASFIYFIHHISQSIQVGNILTNIHARTKSALESMLKTQKNQSNEFPDTHTWTGHKIYKTGYFYGILNDDLLELCKKYDTKIYIHLFKGQYILDGTKAFYTKNNLDEDALDAITNTLLFSNEELAGDNYVYGFRQLSEIGIKAMSPGINDPGTALNTIDYLTSLFLELTKKWEFEFITSDDGNNWVKIKCAKFSEILYNVMATYRLYCKHDITVVRKLMQMLRTLANFSANDSHHKIIELEIEQLTKDAEKGIKNERDLSKMDADFISWS
ncbi:DUF2254 domain-containing protein [Maribacter confluentis]|uniref:DUF2254 domain-containing protein n=1 Tax=Maribacter confluentis TaxID=1656093 RepID=A0ABT8RSX5_9FLAO|nr:DUF2254 domain-containing protein [Maribacter confluentis]MDO1514031.1 DUF2254 domain-containing protein [Maribacter confluentis]